ncbi:MAG: YabP/YqfC family sporulation protein [Clostridia bacterium]|nr:YabP/YqfC family sporulation protein [Clostridia bacterium]MDE6676841.1 YabP/YqfC family sporulation protein [Clostridia bacterium]
MKFISEISKALKTEELITSRVQYTVIDGQGGYFQNVKRLLEFSETKIVLKGRKGAVSVEGEHLALGKYFAGDLAILGNIAKVERLD